ncbi:hypothetical protein [Lacinutrix sp. Hel_I_90]|uniref:hypothetical protein n=1 Tax=Lacinutrix sp. Hel_I_90 TaxID=1249999 RepID=UPI000AD4DA47|nr:hypothetical protein [Lacinutrix sp. Hel_I_90]
MKSLHIKPSWLFFLIPIGVLIFVIVPEIQGKYTVYNTKKIGLQQDVVTLDSLQQLTEPTRKDLQTIKKLEITVPIHTAAYQREVFVYYKTGGMLFVLAFMGVGMVVSGYISTKKKTAPKNEKVDFTFEDPDSDAIGQRIAWVGVERSGSNFASEVLKKTHNGYKIISSSLTKVVAWSFFLIGLNYVVLSFVEYYQIYDVSLTLMKAGKLFFTSGGPFLLIGFMLLLIFTPKAYVNTSKRKVSIDGKTLPFQHIHALQLLEKFTESHSSGSYFSYELNVITLNGERHNLLNHGDKDYILSDMIKLSRLFKVPVWNKGVV